MARPKRNLQTVTRNIENKVVRLHNLKPIDWEDMSQVVHLIQDLLFQQMRRKTKVEEIANKTGLGSRTISKIAYGETKQPRATTIVSLFKYFGWGVKIHPPST